MIDKPLLSIVTITYNHEPYIAQAIESFLMQKTSFITEIIIGEDCSTDRTREICIEYQKKYPEKIQLIISEQNVGAQKNTLRTLQAARGKYIAICDGDDYWTDPLKLQKQVDYLDRHSEFSMCFHAVKRIYIDGSFDYWYPPQKKDYYDLKDLWTYSGFMNTCSIMFRNFLFKEFPSWYFKIPLGDWGLQNILAHYGQIGYIDEIFGVYRKNRNGVWASKGLIDQINLDIKTRKIINSHFNFKFKNYLNKYIAD